MPGGRVISGEPLEEACLRELREETGLTARLYDRWICRFSYLGDGGPVVQYNFVASVNESCPAVQLSDEHDAFEWMPLDDDECGIPLDPVMRRNIERIRRYLSGVWLVALEGLDGVGKTSLAHSVSERLAMLGYSVRILDEFPADFAEGYLHKLVSQSPYLELHEVTPTPIAQTFLLASSLSYKVETTLYESPGPVVLLADRHLLSLCAYQRPILEQAGLSEIEVEAVIDVLRQSIPEADMTQYIVRDPVAARASRFERGDDLELESEEFLISVGLAFERELATQDWRATRIVMPEGHLDAVAGRVAEEIVKTLSHAPGPDAATL